MDLDDFLLYIEILRDIWITTLSNYNLDFQWEWMNI